MKKITLLLAFMLTLVVTGSYAQSASTYAFSSSSGTYTDNSAAATLLPLVRADTYISPAQNIGFTFVYEGINYTQFKMDSNGLISFNAAAASLNTNSFSTANATARPIIAPLWDDLDGATPASSVASYELTGTSPNQVLTVEWKNWEWNYNSVTPVISFQVKLYETTNVIQFVYRQEATAVNSGSASIGIGSATGSGAGSYLNVSNILTPAVSSSTSTTTLSTKPATGQTFTFTPPTPCSGTPAGGSVAPANLTLNSGQLPGSIVASGFTTGVSGLSYQWEQSTDGGSNYVNAVGGTGATTSAYTPPAYAGTPILYRLKITCSGSGLVGYSTTCSIVTCSGVVSFPWTENFDSLVTLGATSFPGCWTKENGDWATTDNANSTYDADARSGTQFLRDAYSATNEYIWTQGFQLTAGTSYDFSFYWAGDTYSNWTGDVFSNTAPNSVGATQMGASFVVPATVTTKNYAQVVRTFVPSSTGVYYFAIRVNSPSSPWFLSFDDFKLDLTPACPSPSGLVVSNLADTTADVSWTATSGNYEYVLDQFAANPAGSGAAIASTTYNAVSLTPLTTYYLHVRSNCGGIFSVWSTVSFTTLATPPVNNNCAGAIALTPGGVFADQDVVGTNVGATSVTGLTYSCQTNRKDDVWYSVVVPASGTLTIETDTTAGTVMTDSVLSVFSGTCGALTEVSCDDDTGNGNFSKISLTGRTPGETLYVGVWAYSSGGGGDGQFAISAYDSTLSSASFDMNGFVAYPNPVKDILNLSYTKNISNVSVHNLLGQEVITKVINANQSKIDMSNLSSGTYLVKVTVDNLIKTIKVVKE